MVDSNFERNRDLEETVEKYSDFIFRVCFLLLRDRHDTQDVLQDTFYQYLVSDIEYESEEHKKAWLLRVAQNKCKNILKYKKIHSYISYDDVEESVVGKTSAKEDDIEEILKLSNLNYKYKSVVILHYMEGYSVEETADILNISLSAAKKRLQRAREKLKEFFEKYEKEGGVYYEKRQ